MAHTDSDLSQSIGLATERARRHLRLAVLRVGLAGRVRRFLLPLLALVALSLGAGRLLADTIAGVVKDPSGALVAGARVEVSGGTLNEPLALSTNGEGKFSAPNLVPGKYSVRVSKEGFENSVTSVDL